MMVEEDGGGVGGVVGDAGGVFCIVGGAVGGATWGWYLGVLWEVVLGGRL